MTQIQARHQTVLITGASSGIGREFARVFAENQYQIVLTARSEDTLHQLAADLKSKYLTQVRVIPADLSTTAGLEGLCRRIEEENIVIDVLVNNAGFGVWGDFTETDWAKEQQMIHLNVTALTRLTKLAARQMKARGRGQILQVASSAGFQPGPFMAVYFATKAFVISFSRAVGEELRGSGVSITVLCPGPTQSGFEAALERSGNKFWRGPIPTAKEVADFGYRALQKRKGLVVHGLRNRVLSWLSKIVPQRLAMLIVKRGTSVQTR